MITYFELGGNKRLNQIVMAGSHDAGVQEGGSNVRTQKLDILAQARAGVRVFDLRIAAQTQAPAMPGGEKGASLRAFHSSITRKATKTRFATDVGRSTDLTRTKVVGGSFGGYLTEMLAGARRFVQSPEGRNEFLILKFDKSQNWRLIAEACASNLGDYLFKEWGNLNNRTLSELKGKVVVVFSAAGMQELRANYGPGSSAKGITGILGFKNLYSGGSYDPAFDGLQYFGKGGTSVTKPFFKSRQNRKKQASIMAKAKQSHPDVLSMMYWTTTGIFESIRARNDRMWDAPNVHRLKKLWANGLQDFVDHRIVGDFADGTAALAMERRRSMPNIIMIDFADEAKCRVIRELNDMTDQQISALQS